LDLVDSSCHKRWRFFIAAFRVQCSKECDEDEDAGHGTKLLMGSGDIAAMVRIAHGLRAGLKITGPE
jgi:hypothetical protein